MKRFRQYLFFFTISVACLAASCSKGGQGSGTTDGGPPHVESPADTTAPVLDITTPTANQVFANGNVISVTGRIADDLGLYQGTIRIINDVNGDVLKQQQYEIHGVLSYNFNIAYTTVITTPSDYTVTVTFNDHGLNTTTKSVKVKVNP